MVSSGQEVSLWVGVRSAQLAPHTYLRALRAPVHHSAHEALYVSLTQAASISLQADQLRELLGLWRCVGGAPGPSP